MTKAASAEQTASNTDISGYAKRAESIMDEQDTLAQDLKELFSEAKTNGCDIKALKIALKQKRSPLDRGIKERINFYCNALGQMDLFTIV